MRRVITEGARTVMKILLAVMTLITQNLLMDSNGIVMPTHLTTEVQVRNFIKDHNGRIIRSEIHQYELSRKSLRSKPTQGGLIEIANKSGAYFPVAGNDYQFASPQFTRQGSDYPVLVTLERRCEGCHGRGAVGIFSLASHFPPPLPPITCCRRLTMCTGGTLLDVNRNVKTSKLCGS